MVSTEQLEVYRYDWVRQMGRYGVRPTHADPVFDVLVAAYSSPDRHYHNVEHIGEVFRVAARLAYLTDDTGPVHLAIWFHDAVYDSRATDNEARSAELAESLLGPIGVPRSVLERVGRLVRATAHPANDLPPGDRDTATLLDADLAILGAEGERYRKYATAIRQEYAWVPDAEYRVARAAVLKQFLTRPRIYWSEMLYQECDARARANLRSELADLAAS